MLVLHCIIDLLRQQNKIVSLFVLRNHKRFSLSSHQILISDVQLPEKPD
jgi:hypothetical protein